MMVNPRRLFKDPRSRKFVSTPYKADFDEYISIADDFVVANKPKQQNQLQKFNNLANDDGTPKKQWWTQKLNTLRDVHLDVPTKNLTQLPTNNRHTGLTRSAYKY